MPFFKSPFTTDGHIATAQVHALCCSCCWLVVAGGDAGMGGDASVADADDDDVNADDDDSMKCRPLGVLDCITKANCVAASAAASCFHQKHYSVSLNILKCSILHSKQNGY